MKTTIFTITIRKSMICCNIKVHQQYNFHTRENKSQENEYVFYQ